MANAYKLYQICPYCEGTGIKLLPIGAGPELQEFPCEFCAGAKVILWGYCTEAIFAIPDIPA